MPPLEPRLSLPEFCVLHMPALERNEVRHNSILGVLGGLVDRQSSDVMTWSLGSPGQCAIMSPGRPILLAELDEAQCGSLAEQTASLDYPGVVGPGGTAQWFAERAMELGVTFLEPNPRQIHVLRDKPKYPGAPGHARLTNRASRRGAVCRLDHRLSPRGRSAQSDTEPRTPCANRRRRTAPVLDR